MDSPNDERDPEAVRDLIEQLRPAVQYDGGDLELVDVNTETGVVRVRLTGACSSCAISTSTIQLGVERIVKGRFSWVTAVEGELDEEFDFAASAALGRGGWVPLRPPPPREVHAHSSHSVTREASAALVEITRPERANALRVDDAEALAATLVALDDDPGVRAIILLGSPRYFSAGADLADLADEDALAHIDRIHRLLRQVLALRTPTIAAVRGAAVGAGLNLALACDLVVAGTSTRASEMFIHRGLTLDFAGSAILSARIGPHRAKALAFFGGTLTLDELAMLVNRVVPDDEVLDVARGWAHDLAERSPRALTLSKRLIDQAAPSLGSALDREIIAQLAAASDPATRAELERWR